MSKGIVKIIEKAQRGNKEALEWLFTTTQNEVYFVCKMLVVNEQDALDMLQETYITAFEKLNTIKKSESFIAWIKTIAKNKCKNFLKSGGAYKIMIPYDEAPDIFEENENFIPHEYLDSKEKKLLIMRIIESLPTEQRLVVMMYYYNEMKISEIATEMECSESTVKSRLTYAKNKIKERILQLEENDNTRLYALPIGYVSLQSCIHELTKECIISADTSIKIFGSAAAAAAAATATAVVVSTGVKTAIIAGIAATAIAATAVTAYIVNKQAEQKAEQTISDIKKQTSSVVSQNEGSPLDLDVNFKNITDYLKSLQKSGK